MTDPEEEQRGFTIVDKRGGGDGAEAEPETPGPEVGPAAGPRAELPPADFSSLVVSLGTSALYHLGQVPGPDGASRGAPDLPLARQSIDTLAVLAEKTRGNLTDEEHELLENLLADLRLRYVEAKRG